MLENIDMSNKSVVRGKLLSYLKDVRKTEKDLQELFSLTENCDGVYIDFKEELIAIQGDKTLWNLEYFTGHITALSLGFSKKRMLHLMDVREYLRQQGCPELTNRMNKPQIIQTTQTTHTSSKPISKQPDDKESNDNDGLVKNIAIAVAVIIGLIVAIKIVF